jgi:hypothetical protein
MMSSSTLVHTISPAQPSPTVFGRVGTGQPRGSWFDAVNTDRATRAADLMKMRILRIEAEEQKALALPLAR